MKIIYRSEQDPDFKCLEKYIENGYFGNLHEGWIVEAEKENNVWLSHMHTLFKNTFSKEQLDATKKFLENEFSEPIVPTKYESISQHFLIKELVEKISNSAKTLGLQKKEFPYYATLPTGEVNACAIKMECSKKEFLLFDSQLFTFCNMFAKLFSLCLPIRSKGNISFNINEIKNHIKNNKNGCVDKAHDLLHSYCKEKNPSKAKPYLPPQDYLPLNIIIRDGMELMIVGHEYGHYFSGHLSNNIKNIVSDKIDIDNISDSHIQEHEADLLGSVLAIHALQNSGIDMALAYSAVELFHSSMLMVARYYNYLDGIKDEHFEEEESETHPTFTKRKQFLREIIPEIEVMSKHIENIKFTYCVFDELIELLWMEMMKKIKSKS